MSIEMKHAERLQESIDGLRAHNGPVLSAPLGCGTILLALPALLFIIVALALSVVVLFAACGACGAEGYTAQAADPAWLVAFETEHGYLPQADPSLLAQGFTPDEALAEHLGALAWSRDLGHTPEPIEWQAHWCQRHSCWVLMHIDYELIVVED